MPKWIKKLHDPRWLEEAYKTQTTRQIADHIGCRFSSVIAALKRHNIKARFPGKPRIEDQRLYNGEWLRNQYETHTTHQIAKMLNCSQAAVWKAMRRFEIPMKRYTKPFACKYYKQQRDEHGINRKQHRMIMEKILGRKLFPNENVHHIDGNRFNNDPSNLIVLSHRDHRAVHIQDLRQAMSTYDYKKFNHVCLQCGSSFKGGNVAKFCPSCRPKRS